MQYETTPARAHAVAMHTPRAVREAQARGGDLASLRRAQQYGQHPGAVNRTPPR
jgi:hypothetical protein